MPALPPPPPGGGFGTTEGGFGTTESPYGPPPGMTAPPIKVPRPYLELDSSDGQEFSLIPDEFQPGPPLGWQENSPAAISIPVPYLEEEGTDEEGTPRSEKGSSGFATFVPFADPNGGLSPWQTADEGNSMPLLKIWVDDDGSGKIRQGSGREDDDDDLSGDATTSPRTVGEDSPRSCKSTNNSSPESFRRPDQTILLFDWDDTLCPSSYCMHTLQLGVFDPPPEHLCHTMEQIALKAQKVLELASELGKVVIVTNAEAGWVELSCQSWLPSLLPTVQQRVATVVSARSDWEPMGVASPAGWKQRAFQDEIERFYGEKDPEEQGWKNILSVGDAPHEREALLRVTNARAQVDPDCRAKSIKFAVRPNLEQLLQELDTLLVNLKEVVHHNGRLDLQFDGENDGGGY